MKNNENLPINSFAFDPSEVVGDDLSLLEFQVPYSAESRLKFGGAVVAGQVEIVGDD